MSDVLKRAMFVMPLSKASRNSGILEGFEDEDESEGLSSTPGDAHADEIPAMARTPQNPEILMNTLRGDMRSVDARYEELAQMVGEEAAYDTPPEVLAMLQAQFAREQAGGIGGLAAAQGMPPPPMPTMGKPAGAAGAPPLPPQGMPPMPPQGMPPMAQGPGPAPGGGPAGPGPMTPPQGLARGGIVQHFASGSDEEGVTPAGKYPPELLQAAQDWALRQGQFKPAPVPTLQQAMAGRLPLYQELIGTRQSKEDMQTQMLLDLASRGLAFAGNVDDQGRPLTGSFASRLGQVTRTLPASMMGMLAEQRKGDLAAKQLALQAGEKDIERVLAANTKGIDEQRKLFVDILKDAARANNQSIFGKGDWHWAVINRPGFLANWAAGKTTPEQDNLIESALTVVQSPRTEVRSDPVTNQPVTVTLPPQIPQFVRDAIQARGRIMSVPPTEVKFNLQGTPQQQIEMLNRALAANPEPGEQAAIRSRIRALQGMPAPAAPAAPAVGPAAAPAAAPGGGTPPPLGTEIPGPARMPPITYLREGPTMFNLANLGTGPVNVTKAFLAKVPIVGEFVPDPSKEIQAGEFIEMATNSLTRALASSPRFAEGERKQIQAQINLLPRFIDRPEAYQERVVGLDEFLLSLRDSAYRKGYMNRSLGVEAVRRAREQVEEIDRAREFLGAPPRITSMADFQALEPGMPYILNGKIMVKKPNQ